MKKCPVIEKFNEENEKFLKEMKKNLLNKDGKKVKEVECTCGAESTRNKNIHAYHCDIKNKK